MNNTDNTASKILFVDDDPRILEMLQSLLQDESWHCRFLSSAHEALDVLSQEPCDLLVSDVLMPGMDGIQLASEVRRRHPGVIRIFLTAYAQQENVVKALTEGNTQQIIPKPWIDQDSKRSSAAPCAKAPTRKNTGKSSRS